MLDRGIGVPDDSPRSDPLAGSTTGRANKDAGDVCGECVLARTYAPELTERKPGRLNAGIWDGPESVHSDQRATRGSSDRVAMINSSDCWLERRSASMWSRSRDGLGSLSNSLLQART
ncbi:hypothetical protein MRB53_041364 [Persea americana]|nr:hypothetical protein MRB53_041364 [Persea americana]